MVQGFGSYLNKNEYPNAGYIDSNMAFGAAAVAPVPLLKNVNKNNNLQGPQTDTVDLSTQQPMPNPLFGEEGMFGSLQYTLPLWFVLGKGVDLYNRHCTGEYNKSLPAKLARFGDRVSNSRLLNNSYVERAENAVSRTKNNLLSRLKNNSTVIRNLMENSTRPEWEMARFAMNTQEQELANEFNTLFERYLKGGGKSPALRHLIPSKEEKAFIKSILGPGASEMDKINCLQLRRINPLKYNNAQSIKAVLSQRAANPEIVKDILLKELGCDAATYAKYKANPNKYVKELRELALRAGKDMKVYHGNYSVIGPVFRRQSNMSQIGNKMLSIAKGATDAAGNAIPPKTALGRGVSRTVQGLMRGVTFGGGKLGLLIFVAPALVDMYQNAKEAPEDQKTGTVAYGLAEALSWVATFPASMRLMHKVGGLRYLGMTANQTEQYRDALSKFKEANKAGQFATKAEFNKAWEKVNAIRKPTTKLNWFEKGLKGLGTLITQDLEMKPAWKNPNLKGIKSLGNTLRGKKIGNFFRHGAGAAGKLGLFFGIMGYVLTPLITKPLEWIFGKPYDRHEEAEKKAEEAAKQQEQQALQDAAMTQGSSPEVISAIDNFNTQMEAAKNTTTPSVIPPREPKVFVKSQENIVKDNTRYIPSQECGIPKDSDEFRTYMPAQTNQIAQVQDEVKGLTAIEQRADAAVKQAYNLLSRRI